MANPENKNFSSNDPAARSSYEVYEIFMLGADAGYYHIDTPEEREPLTIIDFMNKRCGDCDFLIQGYCKVHSETRTPEDITCEYFGKEHEETARQIIAEKNEAARQKFINGGTQWPSQ